MPTERSLPQGAVSSSGVAPAIDDGVAGRQRIPGWFSQAWIVLRKDLSIELHTGEVVTTSAFFALLVVVASSLAFFGGPATGRWIAGGVIWISIAFAAVLALGRSWQREREEGALDALIVSPLAPSAIFAAKAAGLLLFLGVVELVVLPVAAVLYSIDLVELGPGLLLIALLATPGIAASGSLFGAMTVRTSARDLMLAIVMFPLISPTLLAAISATRELVAGASLGELWGYLRLMAIFDAVFAGLGGLLFGLLVDD